MRLTERSRSHELSPICISRKRTVVFSSPDGGEDDVFSKQFSEEGWSDDDKSLWLSCGSASPSSCLKKTGVFSSEYSGNDDDFLKQFNKEEWSDDDQSMWLSSGNASPSSFFKDYKLSSFNDLSREDWLASLISASENGEFLSKEISVFDGSRVNPTAEALTVLNKTPSRWLMTSTKNYFSDSSATFSDSAESICCEFFEDPACDDTASSAFGTDLDSPFWIYDVDRKCSLVSLINLDGEDSDWTSDQKSEIELMQSDFPSPSYKSTWSFDIQSSGSSASSKSDYSAISCSDHGLEAFDMADFSPDKPLFWPSDDKSDWGSEVKWDFFLMSPRRDNHKHISYGGSSCGSFQLRFQNRKMDSEAGRSRRVVYGSGSKSSNVLELKCSSGRKEVGRSSTMPSRLSNGTKNMMMIEPVNVEVGRIESNPNGLVKKSVGLSEENFALNLEVPIETFLGLDEFDGHEGVEFEFDKDDFSLKESL